MSCSQPSEKARVQTQANQTVRSDISFAPKGPNTIAQGRAERRSRGAPPWVRKTTELEALKGRNNVERRIPLFCPFRAAVAMDDLEPRAAAALVKLARP